MTATIPAPLTEHLSDARKDFLHSVFTTALEGGIQYWANVQRYRWSKTGPDGPTADPDLDGFNAVISSTEGEWGVFDGPKDREFLAIDLTVMERGVRLFRRYCHGELDSHGKPVPEENQKPLGDTHYWRQFLECEATNGQGGDYDAEVADQVVQWGLFGQGIYG